MAMKTMGTHATVYFSSIFPVPIGRGAPKAGCEIRMCSAFSMLHVENADQNCLVLFFILRYLPKINTTVRLAITIDTKTAATITPSQKQTGVTNSQPSFRPKMTAVKKRNNSTSKSTKMIDLKYSQVGFVCFPNVRPKRLLFFS